jgi:hypothetical protein
MTAIFAQVYGNAIGTGLFGDKRRLYRVGILRAARITHGGHVIDINA